LYAVPKSDRDTADATDKDQFAYEELKVNVEFSQ